jgi:hypothetical protein
MRLSQVISQIEAPERCRTDRAGGVNWVLIGGLALNVLIWCGLALGVASLLHGGR